MSKRKDLGYTNYPITKYGQPQPKPFRFKQLGQQKVFGPPQDSSGMQAPMVTDNVHEINGRFTQSEEEWNIYQAMLWLRIPRWSIEYQVPYRGGRGMGGQILDFVLYLGGAPVVLRIMGGHWHPGEYGSATDVYGFGQLIADGYIVKDIRAEDCETLQDAVIALQRTNLF